MGTVVRQRFGGGESGARPGAIVGLGVQGGTSWLAAILATEAAGRLMGQKETDNG